MSKVVERFVLIDSYVEITNNSIYEKDKREKTKNDLIRKGGWLTVIGVILIHNTVKKIINGFSEKVTDYISFALQAIGAIIIIALLFYFIFKHKWKKTIEINDLIKVEIDSDDPFEHEVTLITSDKRTKHLTFRKLENQLDPFLEALKKRNARIEIIYE